jgi:hypothetical protein
MLGLSPACMLYFARAQETCKMSINWPIKDNQIAYAAVQKVRHV